MGADNSILNNVDWKEKFTDTGQDWIIENGELENGIEISMFTVSKKEKKLKENLKKLAKVTNVICFLYFLDTYLEIFRLL